MKRIGKKGQWQNYLLPAILAVLVLGISFYFIFNEYFTGEDLDREVCKQSIMVRSALPEFKKGDITWASLKDDFPLKCKTNVIEVTKEDVEDGRVDNIIGDAFVECWFIFGSGDANIFAAEAYGDKTTCVPCARIHLTKEAKEMIKEDEKLKGKIDIEGLLNDVNLFDIGKKKTSYLNYLNGVGKKFYPFNPMGTGEFNLSGEKFKIESLTFWESLIYPEFATKLDSDIDVFGAFGRVDLPKYFNVSEGDLIIVLGEATTSENVENDYVPYMFYFQNGQTDYLEQMNKPFYLWDTKTTLNLVSFSKKICGAWEGIPA